MTEEVTNVQKENPKSNRTKLYLGIALVLAVVLIVKFVLDSREKKELQEFYENELVLADERLQEISAELDTKIIELDSLGGEFDTLVLVKSELEAERDQLQNTRKANLALIRRLRAKTEGYEELLKLKDSEIEELEAINEQLLSENTGLKQERNQLNRSINELNETKEELEGKVAVASRLKAENIKVFAVAKNGKEREGSFRSRQINNIKVDFNIAQNNVAPIESKEIFVQVTDPNNQIIFDIAKGSGTLMIDNKETFYTASQTIIFDNTQQSLTYTYDKESEYIKGQYTVEVFTDGYSMGKAFFTVR